jgi:hypothetical protein
LSVLGKGAEDCLRRYGRAGSSSAGGGALEQRARELETSYMAFLLAPLKLVATEREVREGASEHRPLCRAIEQDAIALGAWRRTHEAYSPNARLPRLPRISVVIPTLNEAANLSPRL